MKKMSMRQFAERLRKQNNGDPLLEGETPVLQTPPLFDVDSTEKTPKPVKAIQPYQPYSMKRDRYVAMEEKGYAITKRRKLGLAEVTGTSGDPESPALTSTTATSAAKTASGKETRNPRYHYPPKPNMSNLPVTPDLEQMVHRSVFDALVILACKSVHCAQLQHQYPLVQFVPLATHPMTETFQTGRETKHYQFNIFMGQTPDSSPNEQIQLVQSMFQWWIAKDATLHGLRTVHPQAANKNGMHRHFHTFNMHQEWWVPANAFFKQSVLLEPGGAWVGIGPEGQTLLQQYVIDFKKTSGHLRYRVGTPTNLLVLELSGDNGGRTGGKAAKGRKVHQPAPVPTSANPMVESPLGTGASFPAPAGPIDPRVAAHRGRNASNYQRDGGGWNYGPQAMYGGKGGVGGMAAHGVEMSHSYSNDGMGGAMGMDGMGGRTGSDLGVGMESMHSFDSTGPGPGAPFGIGGGGFGSPAGLNPVPIRVGVPGFSPNTGSAPPKKDEGPTAPPAADGDEWTVSASS